MGAVQARRLSRADQEKLYEREMGDAALERQQRAAAPKCKSCHAPIRWATVRGSGKHMPLDFDESEGGNVFLLAGGVAVVGKQEDKTPFGATRHFSHFATCPNASDHRRST